ncbi:MAG TPA: hypothetical protein VM010_09025 [Chitinophagaceae bacterium]|nr:hypothetical protein [Chitinophagaceae bacterium]
MSPDVQHKLYHYSQTPPLEAWQRIEDALETPAFAQKLYAYEAMPPAAIWKNVAKDLATAPAKVVPLRTKLFKYAIAATILTIIAASSLFYLTNSNSPHLATQPKNNEQNGESAAASGTKKATITNLTDGEKKYESAGYDDGLITENSVTEGSAVHFSSRIRIADKQNLPVHALAVLPEEKTFIDTDRAGRYMIATTASGKAVRLPKKAYSDYACADAYANTYCKEKIASIQNKMAATVTTDFTDFMDLLKNLQEN